VQPLCNLIQQYMKYKSFWWWTDVCAVVKLFRDLAWDDENHQVLKSSSQGCVGVLTQLLDSETAPGIRLGIRFNDVPEVLIDCVWELYQNAEEFSEEDARCLNALDRVLGIYDAFTRRRIAPDGLPAKLALARDQQRRWTPLRAGWIGGVGCHQAALAAEAALEAALAGEDSEDSDSDSDFGCARKRVRSA
jgi:hypothetical protein